MKDIYLILIGLTGNGTERVEEEYKEITNTPPYFILFSNDKKEIKRDIGIIKKFREDNFEK